MQSNIHIMKIVHLKIRNWGGVRDAMIIAKSLNSAIELFITEHNCRDAAPDITGWEVGTADGIYTEEHIIIGGK